MSTITVAIPIGPHESDGTWLEECLDSLAAQTRPPDEVLIIDDMHGTSCPCFQHVWAARDAGLPIRVHSPPWLLGVAHAMNFGVALAANELVFMLGADDMLAPECLADCVAAYEATPVPKRGKMYFFVGVKYLDGRKDDEQFLACGAAMVTKSLWRLCGGFATETASGAPDAALISTMLVHGVAGTIVGVSRGKSLYNYRPHADSDTAKRAPWQGVILKTRDLLTSQWQPPKWGRM